MTSLVEAAFCFLFILVGRELVNQPGPVKERDHPTIAGTGDACIDYPLSVNLRDKHFFAMPGQVFLGRPEALLFRGEDRPVQ